MTGPKGATGPQGPAPDMSAYYTKTESESRFAQRGDFTFLHNRVTMPSTWGSQQPPPAQTLFDIAGVGQIQLKGCCEANSVSINYVNTTSHLVMNSFHDSQSSLLTIPPGQTAALNQSTAGAWVGYFASTDPSGQAATVSIAASVGSTCVPQGQASVTSAG